MRKLVLGLVFIGLMASRGQGADRKDQLFKAWEKAQRGIRSLVVQFILERKNRCFDEQEKSEGTLRLLRTPDGKLFGSYQLTEPGVKNRRAQKQSWLLSGGSVYLLDRGQKTALRFTPAAGDLLRFLAKYSYPFVLLLDRKLAEEKYHLDVVRQDQWYTYLMIKPKHVKQCGWLPETFGRGRVVLSNKGSKTVPVDMPVQLWFEAPDSPYTFTIKAWRWNAPDAPRREEFVRPEDRPGWKVHDISQLWGVISGKERL
jgi:hypothetical protein